MNVGRVLSALHGVKGRHPQWEAYCPVHEADGNRHNRSFSVGVNADGKILLHCQRDCSKDAVFGALGVTAADLGGEQPEHDEQAVYVYTDEHGRPLFEVVRFPGKKFRQRRPDGEWGLGDTRRVLYRLPKVLDAVQAGRTVYVAEGEKDVHALERAGVTATCNVMGAGKWRDAYAEPLTGATVVVVADRDEPGEAHARTVAAALHDAGCIVRVVRARQGKDAADHLGAGLTVDQLEPLDAADEVRLRVLTRDELDTIPPPTWLVEGVITTGLTVLAGPSGAGKSFVALDWACCAATGRAWFGRTVQSATTLYVAAEGVSGIPRRVHAWETDRHARARGLLLVPQTVNLLSGEDVDALTAAVQEHNAKLVVVDTLARSMPGGDENTAQDMGRLIDAVTRLGQTHGCAVVLIHHTGKDRTRGLRGSTALFGAADTVVMCDAAESVVRVSCDKQKDDEPFSRWNLRMKPVAESVVLTLGSQRHADDTAERLMKALADREPVSYPELCRLAGGDGELVIGLLDAGKVAKVPDPNGNPARYSLPGVVNGRWHGGAL